MQGLTKNGTRNASRHDAIIHNIYHLSRFYPLVRIPVECSKRWGPRCNFPRSTLFAKCTMHKMSRREPSLKLASLQCLLWSQEKTLMPLQTYSNFVLAMWQDNDTTLTNQFQYVSNLSWARPDFWQISESFWGPRLMPSCICRRSLVRIGRT